MKQIDKSEFNGELHDCRNRKVIREKVYKKDKAGQTAFWVKRKKRQHGIGRFCHSTEDMIDTERITYSGNDLFSNEILRVTRQYKVPELCYIIAYQKELDKKYVSFEDALGLVLGNQCQQLKRYWHLPRIKNQTRFQRKWCTKVS